MKITWKPFPSDKCAPFCEASFIVFGVKFRGQAYSLGSNCQAQLINSLHGFPASSHNSPADSWVHPLAGPLWKWAAHPIFLLRHKPLSDTPSQTQPTVQPSEVFLDVCWRSCVTAFKSFPLPHRVFHTYLHLKYFCELCKL